MKKIYFLISVLIAFLTPGLVAGVTFTNSNHVTADDQIRIEPGKYLNLAYQTGKFYSWNQADNLDQHVIGIFIDENEQSHLLDNFGVFWDLDYQINDFFRVSDNLAIANIRYFKDKNEKEYLNESFIVTLNNESGENEFIVQDTPLATKNTAFTILKNDDENKFYLFAFGLGLELIEISKSNNDYTVSVTTKIASNSGYFPTLFSKITDEAGIFVDEDQYFYLVKNITGEISQTKIGDFKAPINKSNNVVVINEKNLIIRDSSNVLHFVEINGETITVNEWEVGENKLTSKVINFAFTLNENTFILNVDGANSSSQYGIPYLVKIDNWTELNEITNIKSINNFMFTNENSGVFINKDLQANQFNYNSADDTFVITDFGRLNSFAFINKNLFFATSGNNNLLVTEESNPTWSLISKIKVTTKNVTGNINFLNNTINKNTYFSDSINTNIDITDSTLLRLIIHYEGRNTEIPANNNHNINYTFSRSGSYQLSIEYATGSPLQYKVNIDPNFAKQNLLAVLGPKLESYVGFANEKLYDIKTIDEKATFTIKDFNYDYLHYVELFTYGDAADTVVKNVHIIKENSEIKAIINAEFPEQDQIFFGLKMRNLLNQVSWIYLGFNINGAEPMLDFWDTDFGKNLMSAAIAHRYLERDLRQMNSQQINQLIQHEITWKYIAVQGRSIVIAVATVFAIALAGIIFSISYNISLKKKIKIAEVELNKVFKHPFDS